MIRKTIHLKELLAYTHIGDDSLVNEPVHLDALVEFLIFGNGCLDSLVRHLESFAQRVIRIDTGLEGMSRPR